MPQGWISAHSLRRVGAASLLALLFLSVPGPTLAAERVELVELVVADARIVGGSDALGIAVTQAIADYAAKLGISVRTSEDLRKLAQYETVRQGLGCQEEDCDAARTLAAAAKATRLLVTTLSVIGTDRVLSLALLDTTSGKVIRRASGEADSDTAALESARTATHVLLTDHDRPSELPRVAVLYFDDHSNGDELAPLRKGLADMLVSDLDHAETVTIVERDRLEEVLGELNLQSSKAIDEASAAKIGKLLGAQFLVLGGYFEMFGSLRIDVRIVRVETGAIEKTAGVTGKRDDFFDLEHKLATTLAAGLGTKLRTSPSGGGTNLGDALEYAKAVNLIDSGQRKEAGAALQALARKRPAFTQAQELASRAGL